MEASEKLMQSLNETWEEKLQRTQAVQKEREKALEELGITVEKNLVGVHTPKKASTVFNIMDGPSSPARVMVLVPFIYTLVNVIELRLAN